MSKLLYIKANVKPEGKSRTYKISDHFIEEYKKNNPSDEIITLNLYKEKIDFLKGDDLETLFGPKNQESKNHSILKYAYQFSEVDKYVISAPMWNLSIPAILKAYIDYVSIAGITFKYTENGPVGLCNGKKALFITSRGGDYSNEITSKIEMGERYIRTILSFFGVTDLQCVRAENLDVQGVDTEKIINEAIDKAKNIAKSF